MTLKEFDKYRGRYVGVKKNHPLYGNHYKT